MATTESSPSSEPYDAIIVGGGPAGATAAWFLAKAGKRALVIEKETFPRFHIGESLLPYNLPLFEEMGLMPALRGAGFMEKYGAQFVLPDGSQRAEIEFGKGRFTDQPMSYQVERSKFDDILLRHAEAAGVEVREGMSVKDFQIEEGTGVTVTAQNGGPPEDFRAKFLIDASGTANLTGNREGLKEGYGNHRKFAIYGHFTGIPLPEDSRKRGDILIYRLKDAWFWFIPLSDDKVSLGMVVDRSVLQSRDLTPEERFGETVARCPELRDRLARAERVGPLRTIADFTYHNRRFVSPHLVRIGDAAGFLDPIFSSGVFLAMQTGKSGAVEVAAAIDQNLAITPGLRRYEKRTRRYLRTYFEMIENFYRQPFIDFLFQTDGKWGMPDAVVAILAGQLDGGWSVRWRLRLFFLLVKLQARFPVVERLRID
ncbi:MAG: tryptophan 7-halogenase [Verrucomicrobiae bacterium]|nr:tryptophan 7-halogenase [Verrucomicrobiae bacterium]